MPGVAVPTAELRLEMQKTMQEDAAVFRTEETLAQGVRRMTDVAAKLDDDPRDRPVDDLELRPDGNPGTDQSDAERAGHHRVGSGPQGKPWGACA
jgi:hypothetical protein